MCRRGGSGRFAGKEETARSGSRNPTQTWLRLFSESLRFVFGEFEV